MHGRDEMRTTLDVSEKLLAEVVELTGEKSKSKAAGKALESYVRDKRIAQLRAMMGNLDLDLDDWREFRNRERTF